MADTTMSTSAGGGTNDISQAMQDYFSRELLDTIEKTVVLDQFGGFIKRNRIDRGSHT